MNTHSVKNRSFSYVQKHKAVSVVAVIIIILIAYWGYKKVSASPTATLYVLGTVDRGTLINSVSGTGQVSALNQLDIKPKVSGDVTAVNVVQGQEVKAGALIATIDSRDAAIALQSARIALNKLTQSADPSVLIQSQNDLENAQQSTQKANSDLVKAYDDAFTGVVNTFLDFPDISTGLNTILYGANGYLSEQAISSLGDTVRSYRMNAGLVFDTAQKKYLNVLDQYKNTTRVSATSSIDALISETYTALKDVAEATREVKNTVDYIKNGQGTQYKVDPTTTLANLSSWTDKINTHLSALLAAKSAIVAANNSVVSSASSIDQKKAALSKVQTGADPLDVQSQQLNVTQRQNAYQDYFIRAPFDGIVAKLNIKKGDSASSGSAVATLITHQKIATISLNELDAAKLQLGDKATLSFDAVPDLGLTGQVSQIDSIGTVTQGVVTYAIQITFDTQDDRIKSGMSTSAAIITSSKSDVLLVPSSAVKTSGNTTSVQTLPSAQASDIGNTQGVASSIAPVSKPVEVGLSNDTQTEIISGLKEGDIVVTRTIVPSSAAATQARSATSLLGGGNNRGGGIGGGAGRALGR